MSDPPREPRWGRAVDVLRQLLPALAHALSRMRAEVWHGPYTPGRSSAQLIRDDGLTLDVRCDTFTDPSRLVVAPEWAKNVWGETHETEGAEVLIQLKNRPHEAVAAEISRRVVNRADADWPAVQAWLLKAREEQEAYCETVGELCETFAVPEKRRDEKIDAARRGENVRFVATGRGGDDDPPYFMVRLDRKLRADITARAIKPEQWSAVLPALAKALTPHLDMDPPDASAEESERREAIALGRIAAMRGNGQG